MMTCKAITGFVNVTICSASDDLFHVTHNSFIIQL
jgi:hypothetical protein